jgi:hypothetical protein
MRCLFGLDLSVLAAIAASLLCEISCPGLAAAGESHAAIAVIDFSYTDTSGEARDQTVEHQTRLAAFTEALKADLAAGGKVRIVTPVCGASPCAIARPMEDLLKAAREAGADFLLIGAIHKMSTLVQWAKVQAIDVNSGRVVLDKLFSFRGDTDEAWKRAEAFVTGEVAGVEVREQLQGTSR